MMHDLTQEEGSPLEARRMQIVEEARAEWRARWRYWIGGIPADDDLTAAWKAVAHRLGVTVEDVRAAVDGVF